MLLPEAAKKKKEKKKTENREMYRTPPTVTSIDVGLPTEQELNYLNLTFTGRDMQSSAAIQIDAVHISAFVQQILHSLHIPSTRHKQHLHGGIQILRHR